MKNKNLWNRSDRSREEIRFFCKGYMDFLTVCKTERECVNSLITGLKNAGARRLDDLIGSGIAPQAGDLVYTDMMGKSLIAFRIGKKAPSEGLRILGAHLDSPRLDLKPHPLYEDTGLALLDTHYYGGIKKYQWTVLPLAIHGIVAKKDGSTVPVCIGEAESDPVVSISDLLPHLGKSQMEKKMSEAITGEGLDILAGSIPAAGAEKDSVRRAVLSLLKEKYDIDEEDFISSELEVVPAGPARDHGLDRSMILAYGQDDRICAYTSFLAFLEKAAPEYTTAVVLVDKEEIGSVGATGMHSRFFEYAVADLMDVCGCYSELALRRAFTKSRVLSSDVSAAFDPNYPKVQDRKNCGYLGCGPVISKYKGSRGKVGSNDATAEYIAWLRNRLDSAGISYQFAENGKVDEGGSGTIAYILANLGMDVIDFGTAILSMHAPYEISSKADVYETYLAYKAFLE